MLTRMVSISWSRDPPTSASQSAGITGLSHRAQPDSCNSLGTNEKTTHNFLGISYIDCYILLILFCTLLMWTSQYILYIFPYQFLEIFIIYFYNSIAFSHVHMPYFIQPFLYLPIFRLSPIFYNYKQCYNK